MPRFGSPDRLGNRRTTETVEIGGVAMPAGSSHGPCIGAANRDPERLDVAAQALLTANPVCSA